MSLLTFSRSCPYCRGSRIYVSRPRFFDLPFRLFLFVGVRCGECLERFYRWRFYKALPRKDPQSRVVKINKRISA